MELLVPPAWILLFGSACAPPSRDSLLTCVMFWLPLLGSYVLKYLDTEGLAPLVACRLVALDKCPGIHPIGIGECARRIIGKTISAVLSTDIQESVGAFQLCAGHESGCEAAVHALRSIYNSTETDAILTVDATNAFNSLNREVALRNVMQVCPPLATALINTYRSNIDLYINGEIISS